MSTADAAAFSVMVGCGETYLPAFALALGMGPVDAGLCGVLTQQGELAEGEQFVVGDHRSI